MRTDLFRWGWTLTLALLLGLSNAALAQGVTTAAINGTVRDQSGSPLPTATVIATHVPSGTVYGVATRADGRYNLTGMRVGGPYTIAVTFVGYRTEQRSGVTLALGQDARVDFALQEEAAELGEVQVTAEADALINADRTGAGTNFDNEQITVLPTINRSIADVTRLSPQNTGFNSFGGRNNLYNNISIDGSVFNNVFGLSSEVGGQTRAQPISLEAVEEISVSIAPYDVRQGSFTGAGINVITKAGTNTFRGSAYGFVRNESFVSRNIDDTPLPTAELAQNTVGFSLGGPLVKNRIFFFVNAETDSRVDPGSTFRPRTASDPTPLPAGVANVNEADLIAVRNALAAKYPDFNPGTFGNYNLDQGNRKLTARLDFNLSQAHQLMLRANFLRANRDVLISNSGATGGRQPSASRLPFSNSNYTINNNVNSLIAQLNSRFGNGADNVLTVGWTQLRDFRSADISPFPLVDIENGNGSTLTTFGYEPFTPNNKLDTDILQFSNNFSAYLGAHTLTLGTSNEIYWFSNGFTPNFYGRFRFRSVADFVAHINAPDPTAAGVPQPTLFNQQYSAQPVAVPLAEISAGQFGAYLQDEWRVSPSLKLTLGVRVDVPIFFSELLANPTLANLTFRDGETLDVSALPDATPLWSPRLGFNYNAGGVQMRGGTGIFTGKIPFVWISNQASNNGVLFGETLVEAPSTGAGTTPLCTPGTGGTNQPACNQIVLTDDVTAYIPANPTSPTSFLINASAKDFKFPQVWRSNFAIDIPLPLGFVGTVEGVYTRDLNAVFHRNANLEPSVGAFAGSDTRAYFPSITRPSNVSVNNANRINDNVTNAIVLDNSDEGYQYSITGELQKQFNAGGLRGLFLRSAYTYGQSRDVTSSTSAIAATSFNNNQVVGDPNDPVLGFSEYGRRHRILGIASYTAEYLEVGGTTVSLTYVGGSGAPYSYTYAGDMNGDGISGNDLIYVPRDATEITLETTGAQTSVDVVWEQLNAYIEQDDYLSTRRGQYAERSGATRPWSHRVDFGFKQRFTQVGAGTIELSLDIVNVGNLLNSKWGLVKTPITTTPISSRTPTIVRDASNNVTSVTPKFTFPLQADGTPLSETFRSDTGDDSRWLALLGLKFIF